MDADSLQVESLPLCDVTLPHASLPHSPGIGNRTPFLSHWIVTEVSGQDRRQSPLVSWVLQADEAVVMHVSGLVLPSAVG